MRSILASRQGSLNTLHYQRSNIHRGLREFIPEMKDYLIELDSYNLDTVINDLFMCTNTLERSEYSPMSNTLMDEIAQITSEITKREKLLAKIYDDVDLKLKLASRYVGKDFSYSDGT